jgi:xanthine/uracil permease
MKVAMAIKYDLESRPPLRVLLPAALQHIGLSSVTLVFPLLVAEAAGADERTTASYLSLAMIAMGIAALLQCWGRALAPAFFCLRPAQQSTYPRQSRRPALTAWAL